MITYPDGSQVCVGDRVVMNKGREPGVVHAVIDTAQMMDAWGLEETGLMVEIAGLGMNFCPSHSLRFEDELRFVSRPGAELGASPSGGQAESRGNSGVGGRPPSVS